MNWITDCIVWMGHMDRLSAFFRAVDEEDVVTDMGRECTFTLYSCSKCCR